MARTKEHGSKSKGIERGSLSLYPLSLETALSAALKTGKPPKSKPKKAVDKSRSKKG
jgi:hypothetical protein